MKKNAYIFPAIFDYDEDGISVEFPDLPGCLTCGNNEEETIFMAKDALGLHLFGMEKDNEPIPEPTSLKNISHESNQVVVLIEVYMPLVREDIENRSVKKTLTIPYWLNKLAEEKKVNFSQILQSSLKNHLGIESYQKFKKKQH